LGLAEMALERRQRHVGGERLVACVGLADEQVGFVADLDQRIGPFGVAGERDHLALGFQTESEAGTGAVVVHDVEGGHPDGAEFIASADFQFLQRQRKAQIEFLGTGKAHLHDFRVARFETGRSGDHERLIPLKDVVRFQDEERYAADMIGVKVRQQDQTDRVAIDRELVHRNERSRAAINQRVDVPPDQMKARVESPA
jgi:hypothetical protein